MKKRYVYALLFGIPGFFVAAIISVVVFGAAAGMLWIYVFGDNPWPAYVEKLIPGLLIITFLLLWVASMTIGFVIGRKFEKDSQWNRNHILVSIGLTLMFVLFILLQQLSVGNLGPKSDSALCSDYCSLNGYSSSGMPPPNSGDRTCSCYDNLGNEGLKVPLDGIDPD